ncbi:hypothetical protein ACN42_g90 [Penicillium freii]|uniref:Uncharacterized protein n=1 Tax=Penicillium freii TaxID=48697 RepID=A0A117NTB1_PENFR|nr:hypothetical protein ACN42_g90 [Penicillium freii]
MLWLVSPVCGVRLCFNDNNLSFDNLIQILPKHNYNVTLRHSVMILLYVSVSRIHVSVELYKYISKHSMYREEIQQQ